MSDVNKTQENTEPQTAFAIQKIYLKDISWKLPNEVVAEFIEVFEKIKYGNNTEYNYLPESGMPHHALFHGDKLRYNIPIQNMHLL